MGEELEAPIAESVNAAVSNVGIDHCFLSPKEAAKSRPHPRKRLGALTHLVDPLIGFFDGVSEVDDQLHTTCACDRSGGCDERLDRFL